MDLQSVFGPVSTRAHMINDFQSFILNNVPYAEVLPGNLQWGAIQYDGPATPAIDGTKPALQWHFGGVPYPITKAIRIPYTYIRAWDGSNDMVTASIFIGIQLNLDTYLRPQAFPFVSQQSGTFNARVAAIGPRGALTNPAWGSDAAILASEAAGVLTGSIPFSPNDATALHKFVVAEVGSAIENVTARAVPVDFDGPAQDADSHHVFQYTLATLLNDYVKYGQLLFWYFGGKPYRVAKAMRIPLDPGTSAGPSLFIGYVGASDPGG